LDPNQKPMNPKKATFKFTILSLLFFFSITSNVFSQKKKCIIYFKDNTTIEGLGKIKSDGAIKFKLNEDSDSKIYEADLIDKIKINENGLTQTYKYLKEKNNFPLWLKVIVEGKVNLYKNDISGFNFGPMAGSGFGGGFGAPMAMSSGPVIYYYVSHEGDAEVFKITSIGNISKNFKNAASEFFKDCPALVEKINTKTFRKDDIEEVVNFYNKNCGNAESATTSITN